MNFDDGCLLLWLELKTTEQPTQYQVEACQQIQIPFSLLQMYRAHCTHLTAINLGIILLLILDET